MNWITSLRAAFGSAFVTLAVLGGVLAAPDARAAGYFVQGNRIHDPAGSEMQIRGISHFGFNAEILQPQYLWSMGWKEQIAQIKSLGFNAVRLPFVPDTLYNTTTVDKLSYIDARLNPELIGKTPLQAMDLWMAEADRQGLYVMLDFHSVSKIRMYATWYLSNPADFGLIHNNSAYTADHWRRDLAFVARRYAHLKHFFAIDVFNEPNGAVRWSVGDPNAGNPANHWKAAVESASASVLQANPNLLIFVQGIVGNYDGVENSSLPMNWGENFQPQAYQPLNIPASKLVLSPHTYGPDVYVKSSFSAANFPANLAAGWDTLFGQFASRHPIVIGEWGGRYGRGGVGAADITWQNALVDYLQAKGIRSSFYWCYTPNSGDTGGILDDNLQVRTDKMALLNRHWGAVTVTPPSLPPAAPAPPTASPPVTPITASTVAFTASTYAVVQGSGSLVVQVRRTGSTANPVSLRIRTQDGTAIAGTDYGYRNTSLSWPAGDATPRSLTIAIGTRLAFSGTRSFSVALANLSSGSVLGTPSVATVTITGSKTPVVTPPPADAPGTGTPTQQQHISNFTPASGPPGTIVTVNGSGFAGSNLAWLGAARNVAVTVVHDGQVRLTVPAGATSGAIGIFSATHVAFTATSFIVQ